ncbi:N-acetylmuramoyl-L-alanine amidase [Rhodococcus erythropolis]|uniref:N-acetylmuramoyl-L-alanine amidase n=1 Tax=Rhodococcus erythropolis TaxID=1833 RepID=UPI00406BCD2D
MTWTGDPVWLADVLRAEGIKVVEYPGWKDRGHGDMGTIWGVVAHHTGNNPPGNNPGYIANHPSLGLCSQIHLSRDGVATVVGVGVAWHAGSGSYPGLPTNGANERTIGIEAENNGTEGWSPAQYEAYVRCCAAILRKVGQPASHAIGHKEWAGAAQGKWDPGGMDMNKFRADIQARINNKQEAPVGSSEVKQVQDFVAGFCGPIVSDVKDVRQQLTGGRDAGEYPGWAQLGGRTLVDALAAIGAKLGIDGFKDPKAGK